MSKTIILSERQLKKIQENIESSYISLPKLLVKQIYDKKTSLGDNPAFPPEDEYKFEEKLLLPTYEKILKKVTSLYPDEDINNIDVLKTKLSRILKECYDSEKSIKKELEALVLKIVVKIFGITSDDVDLTIEMVDSIDKSDIKMPLTPESAEDIEFDGIEDLKGINDHVYKRRVVNCLMQGISNKIIHYPDLYLNDIYEIDASLLIIYQNMVVLNEFINFKEDANKVNEENLTHGSCSEVIIKSNDRTKITVKGVNFIALLHESIRAILDLISVNGLPEDKKKMKYVLKKSDFRYANYWDLRFGMAMWSKIEEKIGEQSDIDIIPYLFYEIVSKPTEEFNTLLQNIFANTKQGRIELKSMIDGIRYKIDKDNFEKDLDTRRKIISDEKYLDLNEPVKESVEKKNKTIIISESQLNKIQNILLERSEQSKNISLARNYAIKQGKTQEEAQQIIDNIRRDIPNARMFNCKYLLGLTRMFLSNQIDEDNIQTLNKTIKFLEGHDDYNNDINGKSADEFIEQFRIIVKREGEEDRQNLGNKQYQNDGRNNGYEIVRIEDSYEAEQYRKYTSWCVCQGSYGSYTNNGTGIFYFLLKDGYENVPKEQGEGCPLDEYGLSMIAVSVDLHGDLNTCTCRWNHDNGGTDHIMETEEISELIGESFYNVFIPRSKEDIIANMYFDRDGLALQQDAESGLYGLMNNDLEWVLDPYYDDIADAESDNGRIISTDHEGYILFHKDGAFMLSEYDEILSVEKDGTRRVCKSNDTGWGLYALNDGDHEWILEEEYDDIGELKEDGTRIVKSRGKTYLLDNRYQLIPLKLSHNFEEIHDSDIDGRRRVKADGKWGLMDHKLTKWLIPNKYDGISNLYKDGSRGFGFFGDNVSGNKIGLFDKSLKVVLEPIYSGISNINDDGTRQVSINGKIGLMDRNLKWVLNPEYDIINSVEHDGCRTVKSKGKYGLMDKDFNWILKPEFEFFLSLNNDGGRPFYTFDNRKGTFYLNTNQIKWDDGTVTNANENKLRISKNTLKKIIQEAIEDFVDEANYPSSFNMEEFKSLKSFGKRLEYCKTHLEPIASGSGRYVFGIDADTVLKLAKNQKGIAQNEAEYNYANDYYINIVAQVFDADDDFLWLEMERVNKCTPTKFKTITGMNFKDFATDIRYEENRILGKRSAWGKSDMYYEHVENDFFKEIADLVGSYDMPAGDLARLSTYGITKNGDIKIVDAGLSSDVYNDYYAR